MTLQVETERNIVRQTFHAAERVTPRKNRCYVRDNDSLAIKQTARANGHGELSCIPNKLVWSKEWHLPPSIFLHAQLPSKKSQKCSPKYVMQGMVFVFTLLKPCSCRCVKYWFRVWATKEIWRAERAGILCYLFEIKKNHCKYMYSGVSGMDKG